MAPDWTETYKKYHYEYNENRKDIIIAKVNCETEAKVCQDYHVHQYPIVYYFPPNSREPEHGFSGYRDFAAIQEFI